MKTDALNLHAMAILLAGLIALACAPRAGAVSIEFDYRFDRNGFFDALTADGAQRRSVLDSAAATFDRLTDSLAPIVATGSDHWQASFRHPSWSTFSELATVNDLTVPADTIIVFVGASPFDTRVLGIADGPAPTVSGSAAFDQRVSARGQAGALDELPTDYGPWGGSIWFNSAVDWHTSLETAGIGATQSDLLTTATHELGHLLGIGQSPAWDTWVVRASADGSPSFTGAVSSAVYGGPVPLDSSASHWALGVASPLGDDWISTLMDPSTPRGMREAMTLLDWAGLSDVGWQVSAVPEPSQALMLTAGLLAGGLSRVVGCRQARRRGRRRRPADGLNRQHSRPIPSAGPPTHCKGETP
ncbi:MAG: hypothetical protein QM766_20715 [Burkholderiaceae bacterium]